MLATILLIAAFLLFLLATIFSIIGASTRVNLVAAGLMCWVGAQVFGPMILR